VVPIVIIVVSAAGVSVVTVVVAAVLAETAARAVFELVVEGAQRYAICAAQFRALLLCEVVTLVIALT
jgi:hypothetical protein